MTKNIMYSFISGMQIQDGPNSMCMPCETSSSQQFAASLFNFVETGGMCGTTTKAPLVFVPSQVDWSEMIQQNRGSNVYLPSGYD